jgi:hypothetical protein
MLAMNSWWKVRWMPKTTPVFSLAVLEREQFRRFLDLNQEFMLRELKPLGHLFGLN